MGKGMRQMGMRQMGEGEREKKRERERENTKKATLRWKLSENWILYILFFFIIFILLLFLFSFLLYFFILFLLIFMLGKLSWSRSWGVVRSEGERGHGSSGVECLIPEACAIAIIMQIFLFIACVCFLSSSTHCFSFLLCFFPRNLNKVPKGCDNNERQLKCQ